MKRLGSGICIVILFLLVFSDARGDSLSTSFVDVVVNDVPLGQAKRVEDKQGKSMVFWNSGDVPVVIHIEAIKPTDAELRPPAERIGDPGWIRNSSFIGDAWSASNGAMRCCPLVAEGSTSTASDVSSYDLAAQRAHQNRRRYVKRGLKISASI